TKAGTRQAEKGQRNDLRIQGEGQIQGKRYFCHQSNGSGADVFWHVGNYRPRDDQIAFLAPFGWRTRVAVQQVILWQRSSQVCDTHILGGPTTVLKNGGRADITVFGPSDDSNDDRADQKHRDHNQPSPGRSKMLIGQANHCCTHAHRRQPRATSVVDSSGDLVAWRWPSSVHWNGSAARIWKKPWKRSCIWRGSGKNGRAAMTPAPLRPRPTP